MHSFDWDASDDAKAEEAFSASEKNGDAVENSSFTDIIEETPSPETDDVVGTEENSPLASADGHADNLLIRSGRTFSHKCFRMLKFLTMVTAFLLLTAQIVTLTYLTSSSVEVLIKLFLISFCVLIVLNELEKWKNLRESKLFKFFVTKGYFYVFIGVISVEENEVGMSLIDFEENTASLFVETVSYMMVAIGGVYILLGMFCCDLYFGKVRNEFISRNEEMRKMSEHRPDQGADLQMT